MKTVSLDEMIALLDAIEPHVMAARDAGLAVAAHLIKQEAKSLPGHYQAGGGGLPDWQELHDVTKEDRAHLGFPENDPEERTGELRAAIGSSVQDGAALVGVPSKIVGDGTPRSPYRDIGKVMLAQEMGIGMPRRSILGLATFRKAHEAINAAARSVIYAIAGRDPP